MSEEVAKLWLMKQAIWQIYSPALKHILRQTFDVKSPNATCQAEFLFLPHHKVTARLWKFYRYALTVVDVARDSRLLNLSPQKNFLRSWRLFRQSVSVDHWDGPKFFRLILGMNSWVMSRELTKHDVKIRRGNMTFHRDQGIVGQFNWTLGECLFTFQYIKVE